ncbi:hypothetical protein CFT13S00388_06105 [Campylobacter fetus subsp. testudinum]|uniref:hypothetical protein n=1 Tax=Campylobacter fetus TaxID=196 RepID=UPI0008188BE9|nr:hypothetical protein [Campylobacter fetus]OCR87028.1 hypothetical protein CFT13S00388_06105 [Campylobacter fetus subsp. testudinum]OCS00464.1 hypothetical protein A9K75_03825 [Campylobacter fetus subsp. testudinum]
MARQKTADLLFKNLPSLKKYLKYENFIMELSDIKIDKLKWNDDLNKEEIYSIILRKAENYCKQRYETLFEELSKNIKFKKDDEKLNEQRANLIFFIMDLLDRVDYDLLNAENTGNAKSEHKKMTIAQELKSYMSDKYSIPIDRVERFTLLIYGFESRHIKEYQKICVNKSETPNSHFDIKPNLDLFCIQTSYEIPKYIITHLSILLKTDDENVISDFRNDYLALMRLDNSLTLEATSERNKYKYRLKRDTQKGINYRFEIISECFGIGLKDKLKRNEFVKALTDDINSFFNEGK